MFLSAIRRSLLTARRVQPVTFACLKHTLNRGQNRGKKPTQTPLVPKPGNDEEVIDLENHEYEAVASNAMNVSSRLVEQNILVIQPFIKWGPKKLSMKPEHQIDEAEALVRSVPGWHVVESLKVGLETLDKKTLFGTGKIQELRARVDELRGSRKRLSMVFVSKGMLHRTQKALLEEQFRVPVLDRYSVVIQILRIHATSAEAKLQVAMAEIPYIWQQIRDLEGASATRGQIFFTEAQKDLLKQRERKIKDELDKIRSQRVLLRKKRTKKNFPVIAVVGYTNAGKTSLIKALTNEASLEPKNQLFATLDVTAHAGLLPCNLSVLFIDTVGFMSDIPTGLIECFVATLEDAMLADVIIHVQDIAHECHEEQRAHVEATLSKLLTKIASESGVSELPPVINVGNKVDLFTGTADFGDTELVSSKTLAGIHDLQLRVEKAVLEATKRQKMTIRVRMGGEETAWLYKNAAVTATEVDPKSQEHLLMHVVISEAAVRQFRHHFVKKQG